MNQHPFHIEYKSGLSTKLREAIDNVFDNFNFFLNYNEFIFENVRIDLNQHDKLFLSSTFIQNVEQEIFEHHFWFNDQALIQEEGKVDYIGTCFYMINCVQEYGDYPKDSLGRFPIESSYQFKFNCVQENLVLDYFQELAVIIFGQKIALKKSAYLLSHDVDFVNSAWKNQLKSSFKNLDIEAVIKTSKNILSNEDDWQNIEQIIEDEISLEIHSTFFWLPVRGKTTFENVRNADYNISDNYIQKCVKLIANSNYHINGVHKSISNKSLDEENALLGNLKHLRYHYLKFELEQDFEKISQSTFENDFSLGFSKQIGFRNSYGLPFKPFHPRNSTYYNFISYPLHIMDSSLYYFMDKKTAEDMVSAVEKFITNHRESCVLGILWHNNFYEMESYKKLLTIISDHLIPYDQT